MFHLFIQPPIITKFVILQREYGRFLLSSSSLSNKRFDKNDEKICVSKDVLSNPLPCVVRVLPMVQICSFPHFRVFLFIGLISQILIF